ncbi:A/G-specific adenine glycosylase [Desulfatiglans anilini]|uniref:A/G-specific adenine glycosylase n=1 Tax=Desulfatiglans anilini TaxID=90728 RepID=UPI0004042B55|nr:A/G-specific adenine glycosylase [Desulfatiglans anilini]
MRPCLSPGGAGFPSAGGLPGLRRSLLAWYRANGRDLPWRHTKDPYRIWLSEIMLQQTQVHTVIPYYQQFIERFPDCRALAKAPLDAVLKAWENLGYYSRARALHEAANRVCRMYDGSLPEDRAALMALPGIGPYTAGAILSIAFGQPVPAIDGNVRRILCRLACIRQPPGQREALQAIESAAAALVPTEDPGAFNQALMDLGAAVCIPRRPECASCPVEEHCLARREGLEAELPAAARVRRTPVRKMALGVVSNAEGALLMLKRPGKGLLGGLWRFPGGEVAPGESDREALRRGMKADLGLAVPEAEFIGEVSHAYTHFRLKVRLFRWMWDPSQGMPGDGIEWRWAAGAGLAELPVSKLERKILAAAFPGGAEQCLE